MAKPEVLDSVGLGRPERRVTFEEKESAVFQITKRSNTGRITAFGEHYCTPLLLGASKRDATSLALTERDQIVAGYSDLRRFAVRFLLTLCFFAQHVNAS